MSRRLVGIAWFVLGTLVLAGVLVAFGVWNESGTARLPSLPGRATPAPDFAAKPAGYDQSCAASKPWGQPVSTPFICVDTPAVTSSQANGTPITLRGYAGGSFENSVVVEWVVTRADGATSAPSKVPQTYRAPEVGAPGAWQLNVGMNESGLPVKVRFTAYITSAKDGARVAEASVEVELR